MLGKYSKLNALREANLLLKQQNEALIKQNTELMDRFMAKDFTDYQATQGKVDDTIKDDEDEKYEDLETVSEETIRNADQPQ